MLQRVIIVIIGTLVLMELIQPYKIWNRIGTDRVTVWPMMVVDLLQYLESRSIIFLGGQSPPPPHLPYLSVCGMKNMSFVLAP